MLITDRGTKKQAVVVDWPPEVTVIMIHGRKRLVRHLTEWPTDNLPSAHANSLRDLTFLSMSARAHGLNVWTLEWR